MQNWYLLSVILFYFISQFCHFLPPVCLLQYVVLFYNICMLHCCKASPVILPTQALLRDYEYIFLYKKGHSSRLIHLKHVKASSYKLCTESKPNECSCHWGSTQFIILSAIGCIWSRKKCTIKNICLHLSYPPKQMDFFYPGFEIIVLRFLLLPRYNWAEWQICFICKFNLTSLSGNNVPIALDNSQTSLSTVS